MSAYHKVLSASALLLSALSATAEAQQVPRLIKDINASPAFEAMEFHRSGDLTYFVASDAATGKELWRTDGTPRGTFRLRDILPGPGSSFPSDLVPAAGGRIFFTADDGVHGGEWWTSDGTVEGTAMIADLSAGIDSTEPVSAVVQEGKLFFFMLDATPGSATGTLWSSDGTGQGTAAVSSTLFVEPGRLAPATTGVYFITEKDKLWHSDGTAEGTAFLRDFPFPNPPSTPSPGHLGPLVAAGDYLFFESYLHNGEVRHLWRSDGTTAGTILLKTSPPYSQPLEMTAFQGDLYFTAPPLSELWTSDGTPQGTVLVTSIGPGAFHASKFKGLTAAGGFLYFAADNGVAGAELWLSDGTESGTVLVRDILAGPSSSVPEAIGAAGDLAYLQVANFGRGGSRLWTSDGSTTGTLPLRGFERVVRRGQWLGTGSVAELVLTAVGDIRGEVTLYALVPGTPVARRLAAFGSSGAGQSFSEITAGGTAVMGERLYFFGTDGKTTRLWASDGTPKGTRPLTPGKGLHGARPLPGGSPVTGLMAAGDRLFYQAHEGREAGNFPVLWTTDGTPRGTKVVQSLSGERPPANPLWSFFSLGNIFFSMRNEWKPQDVEPLWRTDGTPQGTRRVLPDESSPGGAGELHFYAARQSPFLVNSQLWKTNGTLEGSVVVKDFGVGHYPPTSIRVLGKAGSRTYLLVSQATADDELWVTEGSAETTSRISSVAYPVTGDLARRFGIAGDTAYFLASGDGGLWKSDGTNPPTKLASLSTDLEAPDAVLGLSSFTIAGGEIYFQARGATGGTELWKSDGTPEGTSMLSDIFPGSGSSYPTEMVEAGSRIYFCADDGAHGRELWESDGTTAGTRMVADLTGDASSSNPFGLTVVENRLLFFADANRKGAELHALDLE